MPANVLTIGRLARETGVSVETVRYYQRVGLVAEPAKPTVGYRVYSADSVVRIRFIKRAQQLGFTLQEITGLLELGDNCCSDVRARAEAKRSQVEIKIHNLMALRATLDDLIGACKAGSSATQCPIVESLTRSDSPSQSKPE
jgi:MerR family mercuric resistance operon transcriptional regulator